jgi:hypothetical protein
MEQVNMGICFVICSKASFTVWAVMSDEAIIFYLSMQASMEI